MLRSSADDWASKMGWALRTTERLRFDFRNLSSRMETEPMMRMLNPLTPVRS